MLLLRAYADERQEMVGFEDPPGLDEPSQYEPPSGMFIVAYTKSGQPVACGGIRARPRRQGESEIRKMFVVPDHRREGLARRLLTSLERFAAESSAERVLLETGSYNRAAIALYTSVGYVLVPSYVPGRPDFNRAFAKAVSRTIGR
ncbi:MAG: GNAT family N-acetyltransferase [Nocardia sp.]|nr:GNAT family N-acetyltransferase [Nocardia sp.]